MFGHMLFVLIVVGAIMGCIEVCMNINAVVVEKLSQKRMMSSMHGFGVLVVL